MCHKLYTQIKPGGESRFWFSGTQAIQRLHTARPTADSWLPISLPVLHKLGDALPACTSIAYKQAAFRCMFLMAFFAFLRVSEMTLSSNNSRNVLSLEYIERGPEGISIKFSCFKHSKGKPAVVCVHQQTESNYCPIKAFDTYVSYRGKLPGYLFVWPSSDPVPRTQFATTLNLCLSFPGLSTTLCKSHSFHIEAATCCSFPGRFQYPTPRNGTLVFRCFQTLRLPPLIYQTFFFF